MSLAERVAIACDHTPENLEMAGAVRAMLECFGLRVDFHHLIQKGQVLEFFARPTEACAYTILVSHGIGGQLTLHVVDQEDGDCEAAGGWQGVAFALTPENIPAVVTGARGTLISTACGGGQRSLAEAFLAAGYDAYVGADHGGVHGNAAVLFVAGLFYHLRLEEGDHAPRSYTLEEAVARTAGIDPDFETGTRAFRCWRPSDVAQTDQTGTQVLFP